MYGRFDGRPKKVGGWVSIHLFQTLEVNYVYPLSETPVYLSKESKFASNFLRWVPEVFSRVLLGTSSAEGR